MRTATALLAGLLFMATALPVLASERTVSISHESGTPQVVSVEGDTSEDIRTSIVGHFLWVLYGEVEGFPSDSDHNVSVDVSDPLITQAIVSSDGTVTLIRESVSEPNNEPQEPETINLVTRLPEFEVF